MIKVIIIEDEAHSRNALKNMLSSYCPSVGIVSMASDIKEGVSAIHLHKPDLLFLDIELQTGTGFDLLENVRNLSFEVIFTTAYEHYALKAIKFSAIDYLLKPVDIEELIEAVEKVKKKRNKDIRNRKLEVLLENIQIKGKARQTITLSTMEGLEFVCINDIIRCEAMGSYTQFILNMGKKVLVSKHLKEYENLLNDHGFFRIHQSHLINLSEVIKFTKSDGQVELKNGEHVKVSHNRKESFLKKMKEYQ